MANYYGLKNISHLQGLDFAWDNYFFYNLAIPSGLTL